MNKYMEGFIAGMVITIPLDLSIEIWGIWSFGHIITIIVLGFISAYLFNTRGE